MTDNHGSISHNVLELEQIDEVQGVAVYPILCLVFQIRSQTISLQRPVKKKGIVPHPARNAARSWQSFFIEFLTDEGRLGA